MARQAEPGEDLLSRLMQGGGRGGSRHEGLQQLREVLAQLGNPDHHLPPVIHVAGTNGKGSTVALIRALAEAHALQVHTHTSPHMVDVAERICLYGQPVGHKLAHALLDRVFEAEQACSVVLGFPHRLMALACLAFAETPADLVVLETGLGGRLDPTNVLDTKVATVITAIGYDHQHLLGETVEQIAGEKAGIMRPGTPAILGHQPHAEAAAALAEQARQLGAEVMDASPLIAAEGWSLPDLQDGLSDLPAPSLAGPHQIANAAGALAALWAALGAAALDRGAVIHGLTHAHWPGRLHQIASGPLVDALPPNSQLWVDGAHNLDAMLALAEALPPLLEGRHLQIIAALGENKDASALLAPLAPLNPHLIPLDFPHFKTMASAASIARAAASVGISPVSPANSLGHAATLLDSQPSLVLVTGSLYLVGDLLADHDPARPNPSPAQPDTAL